MLRESYMRTILASSAGVVYNGGVMINIKVEEFEITPYAIATSH